MMVDEKLLQKCNELLNYLYEKYSVRARLNLDLRKEYNPALSSEEWRHLIAAIGSSDLERTAKSGQNYKWTKVSTPVELMQFTIYHELDNDDDN